MSKGVLEVYGHNQYCISEHDVKAIDATGVGDTFDGAFLSEWIRSNDHFKAAKFTNASAALSTTRYGAANSIPNRTEVELFLGL